MPINPENPQDLRRLQASINQSRESLRRFRVSYRKLLEQFVTDHYAEEIGAPAEVIVNLLGLAVDIHVLHLAPHQPRVSITTDFAEFKVTAYDFEIAINNDLEDMKIGQVLREMATDAWFSVGLAKLYLAEGNPIETKQGAIDIGQLKLSSISIDNWVHDVSARRWDECSYFGDVRRERLYDLQNNPQYQNTERLTPLDGDRQYDEFGEETASDLTTEGTLNQDSSPVDLVEVWDIFLPREQLLVTLASDRQGSSVMNRPLRVVQWTGPKRGPYYMLGLQDVPENIMPTSPGMQLKHMHDLVNNLVRKLKDQAKRQKNITLVKPESQEDGKSVRDAGDGEMVGVNDPSGIAEVRFGGIDAQNHGFAVWLMSQFDMHAGNLQLLGGLSPSADTLGQEQLLAQQMSARIQKQKQRVLEVIEDITRDIAWYRWHDVFYAPRIVKKIPGVDVQVVGEFTPFDRLGEYIDYNLKIEPYSMEYVAPAAKAQSVKQLLGEVVLPLMPLMMQQGVTINMEQLIKLLARYMNLPELADVLTFANEQAHTPEPLSAESLMRPPVTRRENVRINRPGRTNRSAEEILVRSLMGGNPQGSEKMSLYRANG